MTSRPLIKTMSPEPPGQIAGDARAAMMRGRGSISAVLGAAAWFGMLAICIAAMHRMTIAS